MRVSEALTLGQSRLLQAGIEEVQTECEHMLMQLLGASRSQLLYFCSELRSTTRDINFASALNTKARDQDAPKSATGISNSAAWNLKVQNELTAEQEKQFLSWIEGREKRIPLAYLLGDTFFYSLKLKVRQGCLIPRPETERLVEEAVRVLKADLIQKPLIMDIGTGSGAIGLSLLSVFPEAKVALVDFSAEALKSARENAADLGFLNRAELIHSDLFSDLPRNVKCDLIVSNPPYLTPVDLDDLQPEVAFEPRIALDGGKEGLDFYRRMIPDALNFLKPGGWLGLEVGSGQASAVGAELKHCGYTDIRTFKDHQDIERVIFASAPLGATGDSSKEKL